MSNLRYCSKELNTEVKDLMESPSIAGWTKQIINEGLGKDCLDAVRYVELALEVLKKVEKECL